MRDIVCYDEWRRQAMTRRREYEARPEAGLLSIITPVYNTPAPFLKALVRSVVTQDFGQNETFEWVIIDNGSTESATIRILESLSSLDFIRVIRADRNYGIAGGTRMGLRYARGRYILPLDHDDCLSSDAIRIMAHHVQQRGYPAFLYSDEDKLENDRFGEPYLKPDWDPVLFTHSCYTSHLGALDRGLAEMLGVYDDEEVQGCTDWDAFFRFMLAGYEPVHVAEVLYSWRKHPHSTAANIDSKDYIHSSHRKLLNRFCLAQQDPSLYSVDYSPLFNNTPDWWFRRRHVGGRPLTIISLKEPGESERPAPSPHCDEIQPRIIYSTRTEPLRSLLKILLDPYQSGSLVYLTGADVTLESPEWYWDVLSMMELFPDTVMVGGSLFNTDRICLSAGIYFGFGDGCGAPDRLRTKQDSGYFVQMWKPHSVSALSTQNLVIDIDFLIDALRVGDIPADTPVCFAGEWLGAVARRWGKRVVYDPLLAGCTSRDWTSESDRDATRTFLAANCDLIPDTRYYSRHLELRSEHGYEPADREPEARIPQQAED